MKWTLTSSRTLNHNGPFEDTASIKNRTIYKPVHILANKSVYWFPFYFCNSPSSMLYLSCTKHYYSDTNCLRGNWIFLYNCMLLLGLTVVGLSMSCHICWFLISSLEYNCSWLSYCFCWRFWKTYGAVESVC